MHKRRCGARAFVVAGALLASGCWNPGGGEDAASLAEKAGADGGTAPFIRAHTLKALMANVVDPQAKLFWRSSGSVSDETGSRDLTPTTDEGWLATRSAAATVAEAGNLMLTPLYTHGRGVDWIPFAQALVKAGVAAEKAAADRDSDAVLETGGAIYEACSACHLVYPPAPGTTAKP